MNQNLSKINFLKLLKQYPIWVVSVKIILIVAIYWAFIASDRYVSESSIVLVSPEVSAPVPTFQSLLGGASSASRGDMLLLRDHLFSVDMLKKIQEHHDIRSHYSNSSVDWVSRLKNRNNSIEELHLYFKKRVSVDYDDYAQVLRIKVQAFDPEKSFKIGNFLLNEGEAHMNDMGQRLAREQVTFLEGQASELLSKFEEELQRLIHFQNESGLVSAEGELQSISSVIRGMQSQLAMLTAQRSALLSYQSMNSPEVRRINAEINALEEQLMKERSRLAQTSGGALNVLSSEYQTLEMNMQFARDSYANALAALQNARIESSRQLKRVSILQSPSLPEYSVEPKRLYNITVFTIIALLLTLIVQMVVMIIKDHSD